MEDSRHLQVSLFSTRQGARHNYCEAVVGKRLSLGQGSQWYGD